MILTLQSTSRNNNSAFYNTPTLPEGKSYLDGGQGTILSAIDGWEFRVYLSEPLSLNTTLASGVVIPANDSAGISFTTVSCPVDFPLGTYSPVITYEGSVLGTPYKTFTSIHDPFYVLDEKIFKTFIPLVIR